MHPKRKQKQYVRVVAGIREGKEILEQGQRRVPFAEELWQDLMPLVKELRRDLMLFTKELRQDLMSFAEELQQVKEVLTFSGAAVLPVALSYPSPLRCFTICCSLQRIECKSSIVKVNDN